MGTDGLFVSSTAVREQDFITRLRLISEITPQIELSGGSRYREGLREDLLALKQERSLVFLLHGYFPPPKEDFILNFADTGERTRAFIAEAMAWVDALGVPYYSVHAGFRKDFFTKGDELLYESSGSRSYSIDGMMDNIEWFRGAFPGKGLVIENLFPNNRNTECAFLMHEKEIISFFTQDTGADMLLDLGHLKVSAELMGFDFHHAADALFDTCADRIREIHLSENDGMEDSHLLPRPDSGQIIALRRHARIVRDRRINVTLEARDYSPAEIRECHNLIDSLIADTVQ